VAWRRRRKRIEIDKVFRCWSRSGGISDTRFKVLAFVAVALVAAFVPARRATK